MLENNFIMATEKIQRIPLGAGWGTDVQHNTNTNTRMLSKHLRSILSKILAQHAHCHGRQAWVCMAKTDRYWEIIKWPPVEGKI